MLRSTLLLTLGISLLIELSGGLATADDNAWPTYMHDSQRTGMVADAPELPLQLAWDYVPLHAPAPAWPLPARQDFWHRKVDLPARVIYDRAFHTTSDGQRVFFGSSADDQVRCLDLATGDTLWTFFTEGPVRFTPTVAGECLLFGCDDGVVYCVNIQDGSLKWKRRLLETDRRIAGNSRIISAWPIRTDVLIDGEMARVACGLFPKQGTYQFALNVETGEMVSEGELAFSPQGYLELQGDRLMVSQGRINAAELTQAARRGEDLTAELGTPPEEFSHAHIGAGDLRFAGGDGKVIAYRSGDPEEVWHAEVNGRVHGLAIAGGCLLVSTDSGHIYCFSPEAGGEATTTSRASGSDTVRTNRLFPQQFAESLLSATGVRQGYCLVVGADAADFIIELAEQSDLHIVCCVSNEEKGAELQEELAAAGLYGSVTVHVCSEGTLPYAEGLFNVAISLGDAGVPTAELERLVRPEGGVALVIDSADVETRGGSWQRVADKSGQFRFIRPPLESAGEWTHLYGNPANTSCGGDAYISGEMQLQWFGAPGPRDLIDRHHRVTAPLYCSGTLFVPGNERIYAVDAHNGFIFWERELPGFRRVAVSHDCGNMIVSDELLYAAVAEHCVAIDAQTGEEHGRFAMPPLPSENERIWGFVAWVDDSLYGSTTGIDAPRTGHNRGLSGEIYGDQRPQVTSDSLFCLDRFDGEKTWQYVPKSGAILNTSITIGGERIYFVESKNGETLTEEGGRFALSTLFSQGGDLVALDRRTGEELWRSEKDIQAVQHHIFLAYADERLISVLTRNDEGTLRYDVHCLNATDGELIWGDIQSAVGRTGGTHGEQDHHPAIVGDTVYAMNRAYNLQSGEVEESWEFRRGGHGCGAISASMSALFFRASNPTMCDLATGDHRRVSQVTRPGCWINMIPAGGLLLIPEASSGCICGFPVQTSLGFVPVTGWER